jgi:hypothetical protein
MVNGETMLKWDLDEIRRDMVLVAGTTLSELDDTGLRKTIGGEMTSIVWYLTRKTADQRASIDTLVAVTVVVVVTSVHARHQIVIDLTENSEEQEILVDAVAASITSIVTRIRILRAVVDSVSIALVSRDYPTYWKALWIFSSSFASSGLYAIRRISFAFLLTTPRCFVNHDNLSCRCQLPKKAQAPPHSHSIGASVGPRTAGAIQVRYLVRLLRILQRASPERQTPEHKSSPPVTPDLSQGGPTRHENLPDPLT